MKQPGITLLGLGPGGAELLTRQAWEVLADAEEIYARTGQHPALQELPETIRVKTFDAVYEREEDFEQVYARIVEKVLALGKRPEGVVYAVPGHAFIAEATCPEIFKEAKAQGIPVRVIHGLSFIEPVLAALGVDALPQSAVVDALMLATTHHPPFPPDAPALIAQVYSRQIAAEVKITLMAVYPDDHPVKLVHAAGTPQETLEEVPLHAVDKSKGIGLLTCVYLPPLGEHTSFEGFQELIAHLRAPEGCPWDREQTHQSLRTNLMEEAYEALSAIDEDDAEGMREEFGDLLLQIVLQTQIASEYGEFTMADVIEGIHTKLVRRHPHVFGEVDLKDAQGVIMNWERLKAKEREENDQEVKGLLDGIPEAMPALAVADAYQRRAARVGFDWPGMEGVLDKLLEEVEEFRLAEGDQDRAEEIGDMIFALANLARWVGVDPETALRETNAKFRKRFKAIEEAAREKNMPLSDLTLEEMDAIWEETKKE